MAIKEPDARRIGCPARRRLGAVGVPCDASLSFVMERASERREGAKCGREQIRYRDGWKRSKTTSL